MDEDARRSAVAWHTTPDAAEGLVELAADTFAGKVAIDLPPALQPSHPGYSALNPADLGLAHHSEGMRAGYDTGWGAAEIVGALRAYTRQAGAGFLAAVDPNMAVCHPHSRQLTR